MTYCSRVTKRALKNLTLIIITSFGDAVFAQQPVWNFLLDHHRTIFYDPVVNSNERSKSTSKAECSPIDLLGNVPLANYSKTHSQAPFQWCVPFALAEVLSRTERKNVSGLYIGAKIESALYSVDMKNKPVKFLSKRTENFDSEPDRRLIAGTTACDALRYVRDNGFCEDRLLEEAELSADKISAIAQIAVDGRSGAETAAEIQERQSSRFLAICLDPQKRDLKLLASVAREGYRQSYRDFLASLMNVVCRGSVIKLTREYECVHVNSTGAVSGAIDRNLASGVMPIMNVEAGGLYSLASGRHSVSVSARRWNDVLGRCEYRFRDSNSVPCSWHTAKISCDPDERVAGYAWISAKEVDATSTGLDLVYPAGHN